MIHVCSEIVVYDTEFWPDEGSFQRNWFGIDDHPPVVIQIGAIKAGLEPGLPQVEEFLCHVKPRNEYGELLPVTHYFSELTNISPEQIDPHGMELVEAMEGLRRFTGPAPMYSYGRDDITTLAVSCYLAGFPSPSKPRKCMTFAISCAGRACLSEIFPR